MGMSGTCGCREHETVTHINAIELFIVVVISAIGKGCALTTEDEAVREEAEEDGFGKAEDVLAFDGETSAAQIEEEPSEELRLKVCLHRRLGDLGNGRIGEVDGSHGGDEGVEDVGDGVQPTALVAGRACRRRRTRRRRLRNCYHQVSKYSDSGGARSGRRKIRFV